MTLLKKWRPHFEKKVHANDFISLLILKMNVLSEWKLTKQRQNAIEKGRERERRRRKPSCVCIRDRKECGGEVGRYKWTWKLGEDEKVGFSDLKRRTEELDSTEYEIRDLRFVRAEIWKREWVLRDSRQRMWRIGTEALWVPIAKNVFDAELWERNKRRDWFNDYSSPSSFHRILL